MPQPKEKIYSFEYIESLQEDERVELVNGIIYNMAAPTIQHQEIVASLTEQLRSNIRKNFGECKVLPAPLGVKLDDYNYFEPDLSIVCDTRKLDNKKYCDGIPELIIEVVSPSSIRNDYIIKLKEYTNAGIIEYWIVDPLEKQIHIYTRHNNTYTLKIYDIQSEIKVGIIKDCKVKLEKDILSE